MIRPIRSGPSILASCAKTNTILTKSSEEIKGASEFLHLFCDETLPACEKSHFQATNRYHQYIVFSAVAVLSTRQNNLQVRGLHVYSFVFSVKNMN